MEAPRGESMRMDARRSLWNRSVLHNRQPMNVDELTPVLETERKSCDSVLARFLELRGRRIVRACGALWYTVPGRFVMSLPYQTMLNPDPDELHRMIRDAGVF